MAKEGMITKGVTFNVYDQDQKEMLDYANRRPNFSSYIKRLIQRDMLERKMQEHDKKIAEASRLGKFEDDSDDPLN